MEIRREARKVCCMLAAFLVLRAPGFVLCAARRSRMANIGAETKETKIPRLTKTSLERALMLGPTLTRRLWRGVAPKVWPRDAHRVTAGQYIGIGVAACRDCTVGTVTGDTGLTTAIACQTCSAASFTAVSTTVMFVLAAKLITTAARVCPFGNPVAGKFVHGQSVNSPMPLHRLDLQPQLQGSLRNRCCKVFSVNVTGIVEVFPREGDYRLSSFG
jgi:hypothetical protein